MMEMRDDRDTNHHETAGLLLFGFVCCALFHPLGRHEKQHVLETTFTVIFHTLQLFPEAFHSPALTD